MDDRDSRALLEECLRLNGELRLPSIGTSMWPDIRSGDELRLRNVGFDQIAPGDIVLFQHERTLVAHRVLKAYAESGRAMLLVKGDNRTFADPPIFYEQVVGRVEEAWRDGKSVYQRGRGQRGRWKAWRSHMQERFWHGVIERFLGARPIAPETQTVYQLVAHALGRADAPLLAANLDWELVYAEAQQGRLTPLLACSSAAVPDWFRDRCRQDLRENQAHHLLLYDQLEQLLAAYKAVGLEVMVVKGPAIADTYYPNPSWRPMVDIDLVVHDADWAQGLTVLQGLGFEPESSRWSGLTEELTGQVAMLKPMGPAVTAVELHRDLKFLSERLAVRGEVTMARAWADARPYAGALTLSAEDAIAYASTHWAQHHFFSSIWLVDIALMVTRPELDWDKLVRQAHHDGTAHFLWCALFLAQALFSAHVPPEVLTALQPPFPKGALVRHLLWEKTLTSFQEQADARSLALQLLLFKHWRWTMAGLYHGVLPSKRWLQQHYEPEDVACGHTRLLLRHWRTLGGLLGRKP
ncbi:MAG: hypothetical protein JWM80_4584 [Cyanobacteria bacterium RYN_339]|nr:hypothetical protein [Cyanobacteria bacterium RYN_339]